VVDIAGSSPETGGMLKFNKSTMIAVHAMLDLARAGNDGLSAAQIAEARGISVHHLAKVLRELGRRGFLHTSRGVGGGFRLARDPRQVTLREIVELFEGTAPTQGTCLLETIVGTGPSTDTGNGSGSSAAGEGAAEGARSGQEPCVLHAVFNELEDQIAFTLDSVSLDILLRNEARQARDTP
jgi:Rrf2 family protein